MHGTLHRTGCIEPVEIAFKLETFVHTDAGDGNLDMWSGILISLIQNKEMEIDVDQGGSLNSDMINMLSLCVPPFDETAC